MICTNCGRELSRNMGFCPGCGNPVIAQNPYQQISYNVGGSPSAAASGGMGTKPKYGLVIAICSVFVLLAAGAGFMIGTMGRDSGGNDTPVIADEASNDEPEEMEQDTSLEYAAISQTINHPAIGVWETANIANNNRIVLSEDGTGLVSWFDNEYVGGDAVLVWSVHSDGTIRMEMIGFDVTIPYSIDSIGGIDTLRVDDGFDVYERVGVNVGINPLVGTWERSGYGRVWKYVFNEDGSGTHYARWGDYEWQEQTNFTWQSDGIELSLIVSMAQINYYSITQFDGVDVLQIFDDDFVRIGSSIDSNPLVGVWEATSEWGHTTILELNADGSGLFRTFWGYGDGYSEELIAWHSDNGRFSFTAGFTLNFISDYDSFGTEQLIGDDSLGSDFILFRQNVAQARRAELSP